MNEDTESPTQSKMTVKKEYKNELKVVSGKKSYTSGKEQVPKLAQEEYVNFTECSLTTEILYSSNRKQKKSLNNCKLAKTQSNYNRNTSNTKSLAAHKPVTQTSYKKANANAFRHPNKKETPDSVDTKKDFSFIHSPPFANHSELFNSPAEWRTSKGKQKPIFTPAKIPSHTERKFLGKYAKSLFTHVKTLEKHRNSVTCACGFGGKLWSGSKDRTIAVWDYKSNEEPVILRAHTGAITVLCPLYEHNLLASASEDQHIKIWQDRRVLESFKTKNAAIRCAAARRQELYCGTTAHQILVCLYWSSQ
eukprot:TRINITY_DN13819_c0_g1_i5.p1 TRINITY_DN13819_c0_g1~~TRINITY_DN13819_c0_g1_i5.p1  ORF type:complete len:306 (+),score=39.39 TRINITY_DN13819_c0_g1_i5:563-1480(+)